MTTLSRIAELWSIDLAQPSPISIPNKGRQSLMRLFHHLNFTVGAEIGTERGIFAKLICLNIPGVKLYCVDPWLAYKGYREHVSQEKLDGFYLETIERMAPYDCTLIRKTSVEAARDFDDGSLDFVYIDSNHRLDHVIADLHAWEPKVKRQGVISGHDFLRRKNPQRYQCHVVEAVYAYTQSYRIEPWFVVGARDKVAGVERDDVRSFFWVKE